VGENIDEARGKVMAEEEVPADGFDSGAKESALGVLGDMRSELTAITRDMKAGKRKQAAMGVQDLLNKMQSLIWTAYGLRGNTPESTLSEEAQNAIHKARQAVYRLERAVK